MSDLRIILTALKGIFDSLNSASSYSSRVSKLRFLTKSVVSCSGCSSTLSEGIGLFSSKMATALLPGVVKIEKDKTYLSLVQQSHYHYDLPFALFSEDADSARWAAVRKTSIGAHSRYRGM